MLFFYLNIKQELLFNLMEYILVPDRSELSSSESPGSRQGKTSGMLRCGSSPTFNAAAGMSSYTSMPNIALAAQNKSSPLLVKKGIPYYEENSGKA